MSRPNIGQNKLGGITQVNSKKKAQKMQAAKEIKRKARVVEKAALKSQDAIYYTSQMADGLMHVVEDTYSTMYELGNLDYEVSSEEERLDVVMGYAEALNSLDKNSSYQLLVINKKTKSDLVDDILLDYQGDTEDEFREEINQLVEAAHARDDRGFEIKKYAIFSTHVVDSKAHQKLSHIAKNFETRFDNSGVDLDIHQLSGTERLTILSDLLRPGSHFSISYQDMTIAGLSSKAFITPKSLRFPRGKDYFKLGDTFARVLYIREYPKYLEDILIKELCASGLELAISIHAKPYDIVEARKNIQSIHTLNNTDIQKQQRQNFQVGLTEEMISGESREIKNATQDLLDEIKDNGQKIYSGIFTVLLTGETEEALNKTTREIKDIADTWQVTFDSVDEYKQEALNTVLPIGKPYLDVEMNYMRDMTTSNVATQIPFSSIELQSPTGLYYGKNQMSNNMITIDRKKDLITPSGLVLGSSGAGKGMTVKWELINSYLRYTDDRFIIVDPEGEYTPLAKQFGGQVLDISTGTTHHLNIMDLADTELLDDEDQAVDLVKEKANLLASLFESLLKDFSDLEAAIIDRVTRLTYDQVKKPTLVDWYQILKGQPETVAQELATKVEPYTVGAQDIFAHPTNIDLNARFVVFNIKKLDDKMKPFAMKVILDQIWKQVVEGQGKRVTRLYFDELQLNFTTEDSANWFTHLWSRIRKYGAITTGITQNVATLLDTSAGTKMISNSEFIILLRQKITDLQRLKEVVRLTPKLIKYVGDRVPQGTGVISSGGVVVPFENPIPKDTELFRLMNTDA